MCVVSKLFNDSGSFSEILQNLMIHRTENCKDEDRKMKGILPWT
jgi:hypothetical protein